MKTYRIQVSLTSKEDRRDRTEVEHKQPAATLNQAFDLVEAHFAEQHPDQDATLSVAGCEQAQSHPTLPPNRESSSFPEEETFRFPTKRAGPRFAPTLGDMMRQANGWD